MEAVKRYAPALLAMIEKNDELEETLKRFNQLIEDPIKFQKQNAPDDYDAESNEREYDIRQMKQAFRQMRELVDDQDAYINKLEGQLETLHNYNQKQQDHIENQGLIIR